MVVEQRKKRENSLGQKKGSQKTLHRRNNNGLRSQEMEKLVRQEKYKEGRAT